jgi:hypothetical protein
VWLSTGGTAEGSSVAALLTIFAFLAFVAVVVALSELNFLGAGIVA